jgi:hypothetical protein
MKRNIFIWILLFLLTIIPAAFLKAQTAKVKPYKVSPKMTEVVNLKHFTKQIKINQPQNNLLTKNLFVVTPTKEKQLFHIYEDNEYRDIPSFVTADSVLHLFHIFFDYTLRNVEEKTLTPVLQNLTKGMLEESVKAWNEIENPELKQAALKNIVYFGVAARLLNVQANIPSQAEGMIRIELDLIDQHKGKKVGEVFPYEIDYSQFIPRGHYTRTEVLQKFFRTMMWFGLPPFALKTDKGRPDETIKQSLLITRTLFNSKLIDDWETIYEPTSFYVGAADDITPVEWKSIMDQTFGPNAGFTQLGDTQKFEAFITAAGKLRQARIQKRNLKLPNQPQIPDAEIQFRFMGQRYIPDSEILQKLSVPLKRVFPTGLDVMAVLGSNRALNILDSNPKIYNPQNWEEYQTERAKLIEQFKQVKEETWKSNLYWSWLNALRALLEPAPDGYPSFMKNTAWEDKSLNTSLGSWAQLRHDTILYGKQSGAEMGDGDEPAPYKGYVEPNVLFWSRMLDLTKKSKEGFTARKILPEDLQERFDSFEELLADLKTISEKELKNQKLTADEYESIRKIGGTLEYLTLSVMTGQPDTWELVNETDKDMALIADVHTGGNFVLEEAVGRANEILVIVPIEGKLVLTRGAVFSYYEFIHPASDRLTDEKWQKMINSKQTPPFPVWTKSFLAGTPKTK